MSQHEKLEAAPPSATAASPSSSAKSKLDPDGSAPLDARLANQDLPSGALKIRSRAVSAASEVSSVSYPDPDPP